MKSSTTIREMLTGNKIFVPSYQRAYSWETPVGNNTHTDVFLADLEEYNNSMTNAPYYFGHFLFEEKSDKNYDIIDGQQRLTTIIIFLSSLFSKLKAIRQLTENEKECFEDTIYHLSTVEYDNQLFIDYVIDQSKKNKNGLETESAKRIVKAFDYFNEQLADKDENYLSKMLDTVTKASCTTHPVKNESESIQMFIFQNNRGKKPSRLEIIKAQFMFNIHLYGGEEKDVLIKEIKNRFEKIYKSISSIEYNIDEDDVLIYTLRVYFNSLGEREVKKIDDHLAKEDRISFIREFTRSLATSFEHLTVFFGNDKNVEIHSLVTLGGLATALPFIIKSYTFGIPITDLCRLCTSLESLILRHRLIGTRADMTSRINDVYRGFTADNPDTTPIIDQIELLKNTTDWWWGHWNNVELERSVQGRISHPTAKFLLWKYENHLKSQGKNGYAFTRFNEIINPELEHIAPQTPTNGEPIAAGYCEYDEEFKNQYLNCLGNYLLLSKSHNCSVGNKPFKEKRETYTPLAQHREVQDMTFESDIWNKEKIEQRKNKIVKFILENL